MCFLLHILIIMPAALFAQDVSIWDFRIPETKYQRLTGSLSGGLNNTDYTNTDMIQNHYTNTSKSSNVQSILSYNFANYNENNSLEITTQVMGRVYRQSIDGNQSYATPIPLMYNTVTSQEQTNCNVNISPAIRYSNYIVPDTWHWFAEGSGNIPSINTSTSLITPILMDPIFMIHSILKIMHGMHQWAAASDMENSAMAHLSLPHFVYWINLQKTACLFGLWQKRRCSGSSISFREK